MSAPNGHRSGNREHPFAPAAMLGGPAMAQLPAERVNEIVTALKVFFDPSEIEWRMTNTTKGQQSARGQLVPYADQRAYTDRLNNLFTPAGWTRRYRIHTSANFERNKDQRISRKCWSPVSCGFSAWGRTPPPGKSGQTTTTQARARKRKLLRGLAPVSGLGATFTPSKASGSTWTKESVQSSFLNCHRGQRLKAGLKVCGRMVPFHRTPRTGRGQATAVR